MTNIIIDTLNFVARQIPASNTALGTALSGAMGAIQGATSYATAFGRAGKGIAGTPGEFTGVLFGAGLGVASGSIGGNTA
jgi:hypothetical protein